MSVEATRKIQNIMCGPRFLPRRLLVVFHFILVIFLSGSFLPQKQSSSLDGTLTSWSTFITPSASTGGMIANAQLTTRTKGRGKKEKEDKPVEISPEAAARIARKNRVTQHSASDEHLPNGGEGRGEFDDEEFFAPLSHPSHSPSKAPSSGKSKTNSKPVTGAPKHRSIFEGMLGETLYAWGVDVNINGKETPFLYEGDTSKLLEGKQVVGLYFSASWCGPCRQFTPQLAAFYKEIQAQYGPDSFEIIFISRDQSLDDLVKYYSKMPWLAVTAENVDRVAQLLAPRYQMQGIPHLVILDGEDASVYTLDGRGKVLQDPYGLEFPWRPRSLYRLLVPRFVRNVINDQVFRVKDKLRRVVRALVQAILPRFLSRRLIGAAA